MSRSLFSTRSVRGEAGASRAGACATVALGALLLAPVPTPGTKAQSPREAASAGETIADTTRRQPLVRDSSGLPGTSAGVADTLPAPATADSTRGRPARDTVVVPDSTWRWPDDRRAAGCGGPLETVGQCWRQSPVLPHVAIQETGFPGIRATALNLRSLEPAQAVPFFQPGIAQSPYGTGGLVPFARMEPHAARGLAVEEWAPVQPLDTPVTDLHWMRGAMLMNQFGITLHRMVGNRAYIGFDYLSNGAEGMFYDYAFQVHQPYLGAGRDSLSLVIEDTAHAISSRQIRPRVGLWVNRHTVVEAWADWFSNSTSMANPANAARNDSTQSLYPASFSATTYGVIAARATDDHEARLSFRHAAWERALAPDGARARVEDAAGALDRLDAAWTLRRLPGAPRLGASAELATQRDALWLDGPDSASRPAARARGDRETLTLAATPAWDGGPLGVGLDLRGEAARRARPDGVVEFLGGYDADARLSLPGGFYLTGGAGFARAGAPDDLLFRWQPALGLYANPTLTPRTHARYGGGGGWETRHFGIGAAWESHRFDDTWLPRVLPHPDACFLLLDTLSYQGPGDGDALCLGASLPDSFALARVNYDRETRELLHLTTYLAAGNWRLTLRNTTLLRNRVTDRRLGFDAENMEIPLNVLKGQLLWKRVVLDGKLGLQTRWDWEWFSARYMFASDGDGTSRVMPLDEYLALDFTTQMDIKTFSLYFRAMNLYHDRYATEPGVHPPGVNFRFGVDWRLRN